MTPREPDRYEAKARDVLYGHSAFTGGTLQAVAAALRAAESSALERAEKVCRAKAKRMRDYAAETLDKESIPKAEACADQAEDCGDAIRALAFPAAAPAAETGQKWGGPYLWPEREPAPPSEPVTPEKEIANLLGRGHVRNPREGEPGDAETYSSPAPLLPRVLAALEDALANARWASQERDLRALAAELRAYIAERAAPHAKGEG